MILLRNYIFGTAANMNYFDITWMYFLQVYYKLQHYVIFKTFGRRSSMIKLG